MIKYLPYKKTERESKSLSSDQQTLIISDIFKGQMTYDVLEILSKNHIFLATVPTNMSKYYQLWDLTLNWYAKDILVKHFHEWYPAQISK